MPLKGSHSLSDLPAAYVVELGCDKCGRAGRYHVSNLIKRFGPDCALPDLQHKLAADCPRVMKPNLSDPCGVRYLSIWPWA